MILRLRFVMLVLLAIFGGALLTPLRIDAQPDTATPVAYLLELDDPPAAAFHAAQQASVAANATAASATAASITAASITAASITAATQHYLASLEQTQQRLLVAVARTGAPVIYRTQRVYNGIAVLATADQTTVLAALPGVKTVHRIVAKMPDTTTSVPFLGAPDLWQGLGGALPARGEGVRIAVIDTGVDYLHADLGGPATGYAQNDVTRIGDVPGFPSAKVVTGYDFVGDDYNAARGSPTYNPVPTPDPDPMDCYGHGAHVAGIAAGYGVTAAQQPYAGPWDATTDFSGFHIGPGVAPLAEIVALKVFGCSGASDVVDLAIEWAVDPNGDGDFGDRVDVINMSLGAPLGDQYDSTTIAANHAAAVGVIVVASAGNDYDNRFVVSGPSNADRVVSVAASQHGILKWEGGEQRIDTIAAFSSRGPRVGDAFLKPDLAAPGGNIVSAANRTGTGAVALSGTSMAAPHVAGALALLRQLHPAWSVEEIKALAMNTAYPLVRGGLALTSTLFAPSRAGAGRIDLPTAAHAETIAYAATTPGRVSLGFGIPEVLTTYSAVQPLRVVAKTAQPAAYALSYVAITDMPGVTVTLPVAQIALPAGGRVDVPVVLTANAAAMGRATPPDPAAVIASGRSWFDEESGHVLLWPAGSGWRAQLPDNDAGLGIATFAYHPTTRTLAYTLTLTGIVPADVLSITVGAGQPGENNAPIYILYTGAEPLTTPITGAQLVTPGHELLLAADGLYVELTYRTAPVQAGPVQAGPVQAGLMATVRGQFMAQAPILHVPVYAAPRPVAALTTTPTHVEFAESATAAITLTGQALAGSTPPTDSVALVSVLQLAVQSPNTRPPNLDPATPDRDDADISHVGLATDFVQAGAGNAVLSIGIATHAAWSSPNQVRFDVLIDTNADGAADYRLFNSNREGFMATQFIGDTFVSVLEDLRTGRRTVQGPLNGVAPAAADTRPFQSRVMVLPVRVADLGMAAAQTVISYTVISHHDALGLAPEDAVDQTPPRRFDLAHPALGVTAPIGTAPIVGHTGATLTARLDLAGYAEQQPGGLLLFHHHNRVENQVEVVSIQYIWPEVLHLPLVGR
jgi:subtilisin family serine protease